MNFRPMCVLRSGGDFTPDHVRALNSQVPGLIAMSDVSVDGVDCIPLETNWPGWWAKMELFSPRIKGDILAIDLDTIVFGDIESLPTAQGTTLLQDFFWPDRKASGLMYLTEESRSIVWEQWIANPEKWMADATHHGDQYVLDKTLSDATTWQKTVPGSVLSYKVHVVKRGTANRAEGSGEVPPSCKVLCFHGRPRPWNVREFSYMYASLN